MAFLVGLLPRVGRCPGKTSTHCKRLFEYNKLILTSQILAGKGLCGDGLKLCQESGQIPLGASQFEAGVPQNLLLAQKYGVEARQTPHL